ncbi:MAG TPA: S41 family peptidase [Pseudonocardia sp.]|nr:S41 family peptidase [Pseudonocardia sp.]
MWLSDGYGWIYALRGGRLQVYETTSVSCLPGDALQSLGAADPDGTMHFGAQNITLQTLHPEQDGGLTAHMAGTAATVDLLPIDRLPAQCSAPTPNDPLTNFDIFWATFAENYNSTVRKHVDWSALRTRYRSTVTPTTNDNDLFRTLQSMIAPLQDAHAQINGPNGQKFSGWRPGTPVASGFSEQAQGMQGEDPVGFAFRSAIDARLKTIGASEVQHFAQGKIAYADLPSATGYLRVSSFELYAGDDPFRTLDNDNSSYQANRDILEQALDTIFTAPRVTSMHRLIIDVRDNDGGDDALGLQIAARLSDKPYVAYRKQQRDDPRDPSRYGRPQAVTVTPADAPHYTGPIDLLTNALTVSAGETFTEAMMARTPIPARIGTTTQGVFADNMTRKLPNGWTFTVGNEDYIAPDGINYEGPGIPPTIPSPTFDNPTGAEIPAGPHA